MPMTTYSLWKAICYYTTQNSHYTCCCITLELTCFYVLNQFKNEERNTSKMGEKKTSKNIRSQKYSKKFYSKISSPILILISPLPNKEDVPQILPFIVSSTQKYHFLKFLSSYYLISNKNSTGNFHMQLLRFSFSLVPAAEPCLIFSYPT